MAYYGRRRYNPAADERKAREAKAHARIERDKIRSRRLLAQYRREELFGKDAQDAWGQKQLRSYSIARMNDGTEIPMIIRGHGKDLYLQEQSGIGWKFYKLIPARRRRKRKLKRIGTTILRKRPSN